MIIDVALMRMVQVAVMEEVHVVFVLDGGVSAVRAVLVGVVLVDQVLAGHGSPFLRVVSWIEQ